MGPLSRKARVQQWKSNAVSMCDHYGVEAQKEKHGRRSKTVYTVQRLGLWEVHLGTR